MFTALTPSQDALINMLDPDRSYGDRTYEQVVEGIYSGDIIIEPGQRLPVLKDGKRKVAIKGSGQPPQEGLSNQQRALSQFRNLALDDVPQAYEGLRAGMERGDPRYDKIFWELLVGKMGESRGGEQIAEAFRAVVEAMQKPQERRTTIDG